MKIMIIMNTVSGISHICLFTNHLTLTMKRLLKENKVAVYIDYTVFWKTFQESFRHESIHK